MTIIEEAKRYAGLGWHLVPVKGKVPVGKDWPNRATNEPGKVDELFSCDHDGVGVLLGPRSGIIDLEADSPEAEDAIWELFDGELPNVPTFQSSRGKHRLFLWSDDMPEAIKNKAKVMAGPIEIRSGGGSAAAQTVFPPSAGRQWIIEPSGEVSKLPANVIGKLNALLETPKARPEATTGLLPFRPSGDGRLDVERWLARSNVEVINREQGEPTKWFIRCPGIDKHTSKNGVRDCVVTQGQSGEMGGCCFHTSCGMSDWQALKQAIGAPTFEDYTDAQTLAAVDISGVMTLFCDRSPMVEVIEDGEPIEPEPEDSGDDLGTDCGVPFPAECLEPAGTLKEIMDWTLAGSMYPQPELALAGAIALLATMTGRKISDRFDTRTNLYVLGLAKSGAGKEAARRTNKAIPAAAGWMEIVGSERIGSHAGIINALDDHPVSLMQLDEMARLLETAKDAGKSPHLYNVVTVLMQLYSSSSTTWKADAYADAKKVKTIDQPHLVIYGTSTPERFWRTLTTDNIGEGLVGRLMIFEGRGYDVQRASPERTEIPASLIETANAWKGYSPGGLLQSCFGQVSVAQHTSEALRRYEGHLDAIAERRKSESDLRAAVWSRSGEKAAKLALLHACSRSRGPAEKIVLTDVEWGITLANYLTRRLLAGCAGHVSENQTEQNVKRLLALIPDDGITLNNLGMKTRWLTRRQREEIIRDLCDQGSITFEQVATNGRPKAILKRSKLSVKASYR